MTPRTLVIAIFLIFPACSLLRAQGRQLPPALMRAYESFEYTEAIRIADSILTTGDSLAAPLRVECYLVRGISQYSLGDEESARKSFLELLVLHEAYHPDSVRVSPKIIRFFASVKEDYQRIAARSRVLQTVPQESGRQLVPVTPESDDRLRNALARSLLLPGWGHLYLADDARGWMLTSLGVATLGSMIASIVITSSREETYLGESDPARIAASYDRYNAAYKVRNGLIAAYAALYAYAQLDLLFISGAGDPQVTTLNLEEWPAGPAPVRLTFRLPL